MGGHPEACGCGSGGRSVARRSHDLRLVVRTACVAKECVGLIRHVSHRPSGGPPFKLEVEPCSVSLCSLSLPRWPSRARTMTAASPRHDARTTTTAAMVSDATARSRNPVARRSLAPRTESRAPPTRCASPIAAGPTNEATMCAGVAHCPKGGRVIGPAAPTAKPGSCATTPRTDASGPVPRRMARRAALTPSARVDAASSKTSAGSRSQRACAQSRGGMARSAVATPTASRTTASRPLPSPTHAASGPELPLAVREVVALAVTTRGTRPAK